MIHFPHLMFHFRAVGAAETGAAEVEDKQETARIGMRRADRMKSQMGADTMAVRNTKRVHRFAR